MPPYLIHAQLMSGGFVLQIAGVLIVMRMRAQRWWFTTHRLLGMLGAASMVLGWTAAVFMLGEGGDSPAGPHVYLGIAAVSLGILTIGLGWLQLRIKRKPMRIIHRWTGRATVVIQALNIVLGLRLVGIL